MYAIISKTDVIKYLTNYKEVIAVNPDELTCISVSDLPFRAIMQMPDKVVYLTDKDMPQNYTLSGSYISADKLTRIMHDKNIGVLDLAHIAGIDKTTVSRFVRGDRSVPRIETVKRLCKALNCLEEDILE